jgi:hypothetical protein
MSHKPSIRAVADEIVGNKRKQAQVEECVICGANSDMFNTPGKHPHGKFVCPECVAII